MSNIGNPEILLIADSVAREKTIPKEAVLEAMEQAIQVAGRRKYGHKHNIKAEIHRKTGEIKLFRMYEVVENIDDIENITTQISLLDAIERNPESQIGDIVLEDLPPIDLGRVAAQAAKQVIVQKVRDFERERQYDDFKNKIGQIINGSVKRNEYGNIIIDIARDEAVLTKESIIPGESFRQNDRIRVYIKDVQKSSKGPQIFLSRTADEFLAKLFEQEVPEIYDRVIEIKSVAREPGSRAKMAVFCSDSSIDPVGSCVGVRGARVQAVINELHGEKIDIIAWSSDPALFVVNALAPAQVTKVVIDEEANRIEVVVPTEQLSLAIGKRGQNVRLASKLVKWKIDVLTEEEESKRRSEEFSSSTELFMKGLDVEEVIAQLLAAEGFSKIEEISYVQINELASIEGFDEDLANELRLRAEKYVEVQNKEVNAQIANLGVDKALIKLVNVSPDQMLKLAENGIKKIEDLSYLTVKEFNRILPDSELSKATIEKIINSAQSLESKESLENE